MITIKLHIETEYKDRIKEYQKQYSNLLHVYYNRYKEGLGQTACKHLELNKVELLDSWFKQSCIYEAMSLVTRFKDKNIIFGGKKNFFNRMKNLISKEKYQENRLSPIYSIGEPRCKGNRKFFIKDSSTIIFKPNKKEHIELKIKASGKYKDYLNLLIIHQELKDLSITYKLSSDFIWISFDESVLKEQVVQYQLVKDRIISLDLNPNYIGYSILDWKDSENFNVIDKGVLSLKSLNDYENNLNVSSNDKKKLYINNKRNFEVLQCSKFLIEKMIHYKCSIFAIENLNIKSSNKHNGRNFNKLVNNQWCRSKLVNNLEKWCNIYNIKLLKIKPEYSSFIGNVVYRNLKYPDMILSSIEISRRAYEFNHQWIIKDKENQKNIVWIELTKNIKRLINQSLEELNINCSWSTLYELYSYLKKSKCKYRFPLSIMESFSQKSLKFTVIL